MYISHTQYNLPALLQKRIKCLISWGSVLNQTSHPGNGFHLKSPPSYCPHSPFPLKTFTLIGTVMFYVPSIWTASYFTWSAVCKVLCRTRRGFFLANPATAESADNLSAVGPHQAWMNLIPQENGRRNRDIFKCYSRNIDNRWGSVSEWRNRLWKGALCHKRSKIIVGAGSEASFQPKKAIKDLNTLWEHIIWCFKDRHYFGWSSYGDGWQPNAQ